MHTSTLQKKIIDDFFPSRHILKKGDSKLVLPMINDSFDLIFIDGDHTFAGAWKDLENCLRLCHRDTVIVLDDWHTNPIYGWQQGPVEAWSKMLKEKRIQQEGFQIESQVSSWVWGKKLE